MGLDLGGIIVAVGTLLGLSYAALFFAAYLVDKHRRYVWWYLAATIFFINSGVITVFARFDRSDFGLLVWVIEVSLALGMVMGGMGARSAFKLTISPIVLSLLAGFAVLSTQSLLIPDPNGLDQSWRSGPRVMHAILALYIAWNLIARSHGHRLRRFIGGLMVCLAFASVLRPVLKYGLETYSTLSPAAQEDVFSIVHNSFYLAVLFALASATVFQVFKDLIVQHRQAAMTDSLTGLLNRRGFIEEAKAIPCSGGVMIMVDIDRFKTINDEFGHAAGDEVIKAVAGTIRRLVAPPHLCSRLGGEEFAALIHDMDVEDAFLVAETLRIAIEIGLRGMLEPGRIVTVSIGMAPVHHGKVEDAIVMADRALYDAKANGRNLVEVARLRVA